MQDLVKEYLESKDEGEAARCWRELDVSFYGHQLVYSILATAFEVPAKSEQLMGLLKRFAQSGEVSQVGTLCTKSCVLCSYPSPIVSSSISLSQKSDLENLSP